MIETGEPGRDVSVTRVSQPSPAEGSSSPGEHLPELVHQRGVVRPGRDVPDSHHLHQLGLLGLGVSLVHTSHLEGRGDPGVPGQGQVSNSREVNGRHLILTLLLALLYEPSVPLPSWPNSWLPKVQTLPSTSSSMENCLPAETLMTGGPEWLMIIGSLTVWTVQVSTSSVTFPTATESGPMRGVSGENQTYRS